MTTVDALLERGTANQVVNVASGHAVPVADLVTHLERRLGMTARRIYSDVTDHHRSVSNARLLRLLPPAVRPHFHPGYFRGVVDRYLSVRQDVLP